MALAYGDASYYLISITRGFHWLNLYIYNMRCWEFDGIHTKKAKFWLWQQNKCYLTLNWGACLIVTPKLLDPF